MKGNLLDNLKQEFEKVLIRHDIENRRTVAILLRGTNLHIGIAKIHEDDHLNRPKGRLIALGRAKRANDVYEGRSQLREREIRRTQPLSFTIETEQQFTEKAIDDLISGEFFGT